MSELEKQLHLLRTVDRALDNFKKIGRNNLTPAKIRNRMTALKEIWTQIQSEHLALKHIIPAANQPLVEYFKENQYETYEEIYQNTCDYMAECLEEIDPYVSPNQSFDQGHQHLISTSSFSLSHLPPIKLPPFDGKYEEWESFRDRFTSLIIQNKELTNFARMHFLTSCLRDRALDCVKNIRVRADNFETAWDTLKARYNNERRLINVHISTLLSLPTVPKESALELQIIRDKVNTAVAALKNLQRTPEELWNDILICLFSQKLDSATRKAWNLKFSDERMPPSYEDLSNFPDTRIRALEEWKLLPLLRPRKH